MKNRLIPLLIVSFVATVVLTTAGIVGVLTWNLQQGFSQFLQQHDQKRLTLLANYLSERVDAAGSVEALMQSRHWPALMRDFEASNRAGEEADFAPADAPMPHEPAVGKRPPPPMFDPRGGRAALPKTFNQRVALFDTEGRQLDGPPLSVRDPAKRVREPIVLRGQKVAMLQMELAPPLPSGIALDFLAQQTQTIIFVALGLSLLMMLAGVLLSRWLLRLFAQLQNATSAIAEGALHTRIVNPPQHEIGALMHNINRMAENLERHHQSRKRWIANIAHELRTPVSVLQGEAEAMLDGVRPLSRAGVESMREEVLRLAALIHDLHLLSLSDLQQLPCHFAPLQVDVWLRQTVHRYQQAAAEKSLTLTVRAPTPCTAHWDEQRMTQVLRNLLDNSLRYTDAGGQINVSLALNLAAANEAINLSIDDSAPGLTDNERQHLFEPLYRADAHRNRRTGGSGLGLSICRAIVASHGGSIQAEASALGGLRIHINLPLHHADPS